MKQSCCDRIKNILVSIACSIFLCNFAWAAVPNAEGIQVYQKNLPEEHKQKLAEDISRYHNADNMWDELRHEFVLPHYEDSPAVQEQVDWFMHHQDFLMSTATRAAPFLYFIMQQAHKRHLPAEVVLLPMMESGYNPFAYSNMGAAGIWQMMPGTASGFGIKQNWWYDGRRDVVASTRAALDYLAYLGSFFEGNWLLAIAAYDTGEGNVIAAIRRNIRDGKNTDYWSLPVAEETRVYIPRLLALATIISHPDEYPFQFPPVRNAPYLGQIDIGAQIDLKHAAQLAGLSLKTLMQLNPGYNRSSTDPHGPFKLVLPIEHVAQFSENLAQSPLYQQMNAMRYRVRSGDTFASVAKRFNTSAGALRDANPRLASLKPGKHVLIPRSEPEQPALSNTLLQTSQPYFTADSVSATRPRRMVATNEVHAVAPSPTKAIANALEDMHAKYSLQPGDTLYMVRNGDDIPRIAKHFHLPTQAILAVNQIDTNSRMHVGAQIIIPTHLSAGNSAQKYVVASGDTVYVVRHGDTMKRIARKFHTSPSAIRVANMIADRDVQTGIQLIIPTHVG